MQQKQPMRFDDTVAFGGGASGVVLCCLAEESDVEGAVIGHGNVEGPFTEIDELDIERDDRYPVRVRLARLSKIRDL